MAETLLAESKLRLVFQAGIDEDGKPILKAKTFGNVNKAVTADQLYQVTQAVVSLSADELSGAQRMDSLDLLA
ncbi:DUF1659 domain-containing protein [Neobacillus sp. FSL H8-0543]|uniref:DUF1659 domain-containing protein n=1 Tax=Neobacillus sp. FSL H8-0543 TaxID=2954672 RepID=UPI0031597B77